MTSEHGQAGRRSSGALEAAVLHVLQAAWPERLSPGQVRERLDVELSYSTVVTALSRMFGKGVLTREKRKRAYAYGPVADAHGLTARRMRQMLDADEDRHAVLGHFVGELSADDERFLRRLLRDEPDMR